MSEHRSEAERVDQFLRGVALEPIRQRSATPPPWQDILGPGVVDVVPVWSFTGSRGITYTWRPDWVDSIHDEVWAE